MFNDQYSVSRQFFHVGAPTTSAGRRSEPVPEGQVHSSVRLRALMLGHIADKWHAVHCHIFSSGVMHVVPHQLISFDASTFYAVPTSHCERSSVLDSF